MASAFALGLAVLCMLDGAAAGQELRYEPFARWRLGWTGGPTVYAGDQEAQRLDLGATGFFVGGELMHHFNQVASLGVGAFLLKHPRLDDSDQFRSTMQAVARVAQPAGRRLSPYLQAGLHYTIGASRGGSGPLVGAGINLRLSRSLSIYTETDVHLVYPGDVLDGSVNAHHFDALGFFGIGMRITDIRAFFGKRPILNITAIRHQGTLERGSPVHFSAELNSPQRGTQFVWEFDDGETGAGNPVQHTFLSDGVHRIVVTATNRNGTAIRYLPVDVGLVASALDLEAPPPPSQPPLQRNPDPTEPAPRQPSRRTERASPAQPPTEAATSAAAADETPPVALPFSGYTLVIASRQRLAEARDIAEPLIARGVHPLIFASTVRGETWYRVTLGQYPNRALADRGKLDLPEEAPQDTWIAFVDGQVPVMAPAVATATVPNRAVSAEPAGSRPSETAAAGARTATPPRGSENAVTARFTFVVTSFSSRASAETTVARYRDLGFAAQVRPVVVGGAERFRVTVGAYASREAAEAGRSSLPQDVRDGAWILTLEE